MKKMILLIIITVILSVTYPSTVLEDAFGNSEEFYITFYLDKEINLPYAVTTESGLGYEMKAEAIYAKEVRKTLGDAIKGESIKVRGGKDTANAFLNYYEATVISSQIIGDNEYIYAYSRQLKDYVTVGGAKINIQIAISEDEILIGTPLILGSC